MNINRGIWEDEEVFLGLFKGVAKEGGTSSGNFSEIAGTASISFLRSMRFAARTATVLFCISKSETLSWRNGKGFSQPTGPQEAPPHSVLEPVSK